VWKGGTLPKDTFTTCRGGGASPQITTSHGGRTDMVTWDEIQQSTYMIPNIVHLIMGFLCFSYYLAPHVFPLILMMLNIIMFTYKNSTKIKKTYDSLYQIWSEKSNVPKISEKNPVIKKIENFPRPLNFERIERKNSENLDQNLSFDCHAEPNMKNEMSHWIFTKNQLGSVAPSSNTDDSFLRRWHTRFRNIVPWIDGFLLAF
jgi:hypothetical protein